MSAGQDRRLQRVEDAASVCRDGRYAGRRGLAAYLELQDGKSDRAYLESVPRPEWPPWPPEADGRHHAWVREHWTQAAADDFDFESIAQNDIRSATMRLLAGGALAGLPAADVFAEADLPAPRPGFAGTVRDYLAELCPECVDDFDSEVRLHEYSHKTWPAAVLAESREGARRTLAERRRIPHDPTDAERAKLLERRGIGIRGEHNDWRLGIAY